MNRTRNLSITTVFLSLVVFAIGATGLFMLGCSAVLNWKAM